MSDIYSEQQRSDLMKKIGSKNTKPEIIIRKIVHSAGYRFRLHRKDLPGTPDLVFPKFKKVIFINGCFWHGHQGCKKSSLPTTKKELWEEKIKKNIERDSKNIADLKKRGWETLIIWECEIKKKNYNMLTINISNFLKPFQPE